jgi:small subunit ribosomal protein S21
LQVFVRDNNVDQALRALKRKMQREGVFREMKRRRFYEKPSERMAREKSEAIRRARKLARKRAQREGLIPAPRKKELEAGKAVGRRRAATHR